MNLAVVYSRASVGIQAPIVTIEVHLSKGLPGLSIVGLPETAVKESRHRVRSAMLNSGFEFPVRRITVNLAPADLPKEGGRFDLPIALGILAASGQVPSDVLSNYEFVGELALCGELRSCHGLLPFAIATRQANRGLIVPLANAQEASLAGDLSVYAANHLLEVCAHLTQTQLLPNLSSPPDTEISTLSYLDIEQIQGQMHGRRALEIAASGGHSLLMMGPPGAGKTMLASRLPSILPPLTEAEALEVAAVYSMSRLGFDIQNWRIRPFRAPHHTISSVALVGGSSPPQPGEVSLAHHGVLFLDELPEFNRSVLEALREPLEAGLVNVSRASYQTEFPAGFQLIAAMNPCPCGYQGSTKDLCRCTAEQIQRYQHRISGPLLDRIDMHLMIPALSPSFLINSGSSVCFPTETSAQVRERVSKVRQCQLLRQGKINAALRGKELTEYCSLEVASQNFLLQAIERSGLSARAYHRVLKLARTIADMGESEVIDLMHVQEAVSYRRSSICNGSVGIPVYS